MKELDGERIMKLETKMMSKDGTLSKFLRKFPGYTPSKEKEEPNKKGSKEAPEKGHTMITYNVNNVNANGGGNGNDETNGCSYKGFMACNLKENDGKGGAIAPTRWIEKMESVIENSGCVENQKGKSGILTDEAHSYGTLTKDNEKRKGVEETSKPKGS
nr:reverse transcriptase domain-containing protein [Tanacetum cinerariifolium]